MNDALHIINRHEPKGNPEYPTMKWDIHIGQSALVL